MKLIVGIDPGTTVGYAVLDLEGKLISIGSAKELSLDALVSIISKLGTVLVVGCDKSKVPSFVQDFATKFHAKLVKPKEDISIVDKRSLASGHAHKNAHEMDALASAITAQRKIQPLLRKIRANLSAKDSLSLFEDVVDLVIREQLSIHAALSILSPEPKQDEKRESEEVERDADLVSLYSSLKNARREIAALRKQNRFLFAENAELENKYSALKKKAEKLVKPKSRKKLAAEKERRIMLLAKELEASKQRGEALKRQVLRLERLMLDHEGLMAVERIDRLSGNRLPAGEVVYVDDPNEFSNSFISKIDASIILYRRPPSRNVRDRLRFAFVDGKKVVKEKLGSIVLVDKSRLDKARASKEVLEKVVSEYKKSRAP